MLERINGMIWGNGLVFLLLSAGIIYTFRLGFIQFRFLPRLIHSLRSGSAKKNSSGMSQLRTVCLSLGTAMGTGNITGVASAIAIGGAGAVFWMWVSAFFGMALVYAENYLAITYRKSEKCCGPMAYLKYGLGSNALAVFFAVCCLAAALGMGGMIQVSSFTDSLYRCCDIKPVVAAAVIFAVIFLVIKGGTGRIGAAAQTLLPVVTIAYAGASMLVIFRCRENILPAFSDIFSQAFSPAPAAGGISGFAVSRAVSAGIRRGIFSNEAGLGSSPILHSTAGSDSPQLQGMWSMFEVFFDTMICCTLTALVLLTSGNGTEISIADAFSTILHGKTDLFLTASMGIFAFCTIIGWYYCGETAFKFLSAKADTRIFCFLYALFASLGAVFALETVWTLSDIFNGLMAIPNLVGLILLIRKVQKE